nr:MAG TPA: Major capsid protein [Caudoviricetes sp.]
MTLIDLITANRIATYWDKAFSNTIPYLGETLFPAKRADGLTISWIKGSKGLPVALKPSNYDAKATYRDRIGVKKIDADLPFFREGMLIKEQDRQKLLQMEANNRALYTAVITNVMDDASELIEGAKVQAERMRMQLLIDAKVVLSANNTVYEFNYDTDGTWKTKNFMQLSGTAMWSDSEHCNPIEDVRTMQTKITNATGTKPTRAILNTKTMEYLRKSKAIKLQLNPLANGANIVNEEDIKSLFRATLGITLAIYDKQFKDENKAEMKYFPDDYFVMLPAEVLGYTYYGVTPEEADLMSGKSNTECHVVNNGIAVTTILHSHPVNKETIVSQTVLPSYENIDKVAVIKVK